MSDSHPRIIKNSLSRKCKRCTGVHDYITRLADDVMCDTPVAYSYEHAEKVARIVAQGVQDVEHIPDNMIIVLDDSARKLPRAKSSGQLAQFEIVEGVIS